MRSLQSISLLFLLLLLAGCPLRQHQPASTASAQLSVRGEGVILAKPDQVEMWLEAVTSATEAETALTKNSAAIERLMQMLMAEGLTAQEYATGQFSIQPEWSRPPRPAPANWAPEIVGYRVSNRLQITTRQVELAGRLLTLAQQAGINRTGNLHFSLADPEAVKREAIAVATQRARQRAAVLAKAAGVTLGGVLEARIEDAGTGQPQPMLAEAAMLRSSTSVPVSAGEVEVRAAVILRYALVPCYAAAVEL